jgi:hypothetical protein
MAMIETEKGLAACNASFLLTNRRQALEKEPSVGDRVAASVSASLHSGENLANLWKPISSRYPAQAAEQETDLEVRFADSIIVNEIFERPTCQGKVEEIQRLKLFGNCYRDLVRQLEEVHLVCLGQCTLVVLGGMAEASQTRTHGALKYTGAEPR